MANFSLDLLTSLRRAVDSIGRRWMPHEMTPAGVTAGDWILAHEHNADYTVVEALAYARYLAEASALREAEAASGVARTTYRAMVSGMDDPEAEAEEDDDGPQPVEGCSPELLNRLREAMERAADVRYAANKAAQTIVDAAKERYWAAVKGQ